jgi:hypothetical protein
VLKNTPSLSQEQLVSIGSLFSLVFIEPNHVHNPSQPSKQPQAIAAAASPHHHFSQPNLHREPVASPAIINLSFNHNRQISLLTTIFQAKHK